MGKDEGEHCFSKREIKVVSPNIEGGRYKRVLKVEVETPKGKRRAVLKFPRVFEKGSNRRLTDEEREQVDTETHDLRKLKVLIPPHVPGYIGKYKSSNQEGILIEEVEGSLISDRRENILIKPTREQWNRFESSVISLADQDIFLDFDTLLLHNFMLGKLPNSDQEEIILIEPRIIEHESEDMRVIERQYVLGGLRAGFNRLFQDKENTH
jgi:hypothetical protein